MDIPTDKLAGDPLPEAGAAKPLEALSTLSQCLLQLEDGSASAALGEAVSGVSSIAATARRTGRCEVAELCELGEEVLRALASGNRAASGPVIDVLLEMCDTLATLADLDGAAIEQHGPEVTALAEKLRALPREVLPSPSSASPPRVWPAPGSGLDPELVGQFKVESTEGLQMLEAVLLEFERTPRDGDCVHAIFRVVHNIKGAADYVGLAQIKTLSHRLEDLLDLVRAGRCETTAVISDLVFRTVDELTAMIANLATDAEQDRDLTALATALLAASQTATHAPAAEPPAADAADDLAVYVDSAEQQLESIAACCDKLLHGDASDAMLATLHRAVTTLLAATAFIKGPALGNSVRELFEAVRTLRDGINPLRERLATAAPSQPSCVAACCEEIVQGDSSHTVLHALRDALTAMCETAAHQGSPALIEAAKVLLRDVGAFEETRKHNAAQLRGFCPAAAPNEENNSAPRQTPAAAGCAGRSVAAGIATAPASATTAAARHEERSASPSAAAASKTMRVDQGKLDDYINLTGELVIARNALVHEFGQCRIDAAHHNRLKESVERVQRIVADIQANAMSMRMVPVMSVFQRFPRMVRDLAKAQGKQIEIKLLGEDTELDKQVAEKLGDPLVHLIRNSADHGIELPDVRRAAGKSEAGLITLKAGREGSSILIEILDDGRGIDVARLKAKAVEKGILRQEQADDMPREKALELIFAAGLSTAKVVSDISGRGVGMDVVRSNITDLGGAVSVLSEDGKGSRIRLQLPLTLAVTSGVLVSAAEGFYAIPMEAVKETVKVLPENVRTLNGQYAFSLRNRIIPIVSLAGVLSSRGLPRAAETPRGLATDRSGRIPLDVVAAGVTVYGIGVDELKGQQEVVIKPLPTHLGQLPGVGGATIMGDGSVVLILDPASLYDFVVSSPGTTATDSARALRGRAVTIR